MPIVKTAPPGSWSKKMPMSKTGIVAGKALDTLAEPSALGLLDLAPAGMTRMLKGKKVYHGYEKGFGGSVNRLQEIAAEKEAMNRYVSKYGKYPAYNTAEHFGAEVMLEKLTNDVLLEQGIRKPLKVFEHFSPNRVGTGAGGNLYGEGIYLTEHPKIAASYAKPTRGQGVVRKQNIPPQAKILDIDKVLSLDDLKKISETATADSAQYGPLAEWAESLYKNGVPVTVQELTYGWLKGSKEAWPVVARDLGYDGISYKAGQVGGLPPGVPKGTRNYVIYNYDLINKPRETVKQRLPKKAITPTTRSK